MSKFVEWMDKKFIEDWRNSFSFISVRAAGVLAAVLSTLISSPDILFSIINFMPADPVERAVMATGVGVIAFLGPWILRIWNQEKPDV